MPEYGSPDNNLANIPSEQIRYDLNGNPIPTTGAGVDSGRTSPPPQPQPAPYAPPASGYGAAPPPGYGIPPSQPPPSQFGYGAPPPAYSPGPRPYGPPGTQSAASDPSGVSAKVGWVIGILAALFFIGMLVALPHLIKPPVIPAPTSYATAESGDKSFTVSGPAGWTTESVGEQGSQGGGGVLFKQGPVKIDISSSDQLSFMSDAMKGPGMMPTGDPNLPPIPSGGGESDTAPTMAQTPVVEKMHAMLKGQLSSKYGDYTEQPMEPLHDQFGDTRISEWTGKGGMFDGQLHGYRVTMVGVNKVITVDCHCPEANWATMQPVFLKVLQSITPDNG